MSVWNKNRIYSYKGSFVWAKDRLDYWSEKAEEYCEDYNKDVNFNNIWWGLTCDHFMFELTEYDYGTYRN